MNRKRERMSSRHSVREISQEKFRRVNLFLSTIVIYDFSRGKTEEERGKREDEEKIRSRETLCHGLLIPDEDNPKKHIM